LILDRFKNQFPLIFQLQRMNPENTEVPLLATPTDAEQHAVDNSAAAGILADDSLLGPALEGEALEEEIRRQVEYFLSREYLSTDPYLVSQMNSDMYFPITTVATLTTFKVDLEVLVKTLRKSTSLSVNDNGTMVKPNFKIQRNTLILRDIPSSTKVEEVQAIFQGEGCPATTGIRPDIGDCWFVTFNSEEDALKALDFVRGRTFQDAPVKARIKSENLLRSFTTYYPPAAAGDLGMKMGGQYTGYNYYPQYAGQQGDHQEHRRTRGGGSGGHRQPGGNPTGPRKEYRGGNNGNKYSNDGVLGAGHPTHTGGSPALAAAPGAPITSPPVPNTNAARGSQASADSDNRKQRRQPGPRTGNTRKQEGTTTNTTTTTQTANPKPSQSQQPLQFGLAHFPPLSSQSQQPKHTGYTKDFTKFTKQQLIDIVTSTPVPNQQPSSFPSECLATLAEPNTQVVISPESNLDRLRPQENSASASPRQEGEVGSTTTVPTPAQPTMTMASLVATHKSIPAPAPKKPQPKAKPAPQPKKEPATAQGKGQQAAKKASPPTNARKSTAQRKKPDEGAAQQSATPSAPASASPTPAAGASATTAPASPAASSPSPAPAAAPVTSSAAPASPTPAAAPSSGSSTPTYAQLAAKAASKQPVQPKKDAEKRDEPKEAKKDAEKKESEKKDEPKKEEKESASA
jgi:la-related protein 4